MQDMLSIARSIVESCYGSTVGLAAWFFPFDTVKSPYSGISKHLLLSNYLPSRNCHQTRLPNTPTCTGKDMHIRLLAHLPTDTRQPTYGQNRSSVLVDQFHFMATSSPWCSFFVTDNILRTPQKKQGRKDQQ